MSSLKLTWLQISRANTEKNVSGVNLGLQTFNVVIDYAAGSKTGWCYPLTLHHGIFQYPCYAAMSTSTSPMQLLFAVAPWQKNACTQYKSIAVHVIGNAGTLKIGDCIVNQKRSS